MVKRKKSKSSVKPKSSIDRFFSNYWAVASIILGLLLIISLVTQGVNSGGASISSNEAGQSVVNFAEEQGASASLVEVKDAGSLYEVIVEIQGQQVPVYVTKDGSNLVPSVIPLGDTPAATNTPTNTPSAASGETPTIPKSDRPKIELFVMSHCPYGTQAEKGFLPVVDLLKDYIDFDVKFVYYAMHGEVEVVEQLNQYCIQEEQNEKFLPYLSCFLEDGDSERCLTATSIDTNALKTCTDAADVKFNAMANLADTSSYLSGRFPLFDTHKEDNSKYGVGGSPTLVINGEKIETQGNNYAFNGQLIPYGRDAETYKTIVCSLFNEAPEECGEDLSSLGSPGPGFGFDTQGGSAAAAGCGY